MQGYSHALTGAAGWLMATTAVHVPLGFLGYPGVAVPLSANLFVTPVETALIGAVVCAGAAMLPDTDHPQGSIAHSLPPVTQLLCHGVNHVSGGHRHGTHSFVGVAAFMVVALLASVIVVPVQGRTVAVGAGIVAVLLTAFAVKALRVKPGGRGSVLNTAIGPWVISVLTAGAATYLLDYRWEWLAFAVGWGAFIHIVGDGLTTQGVPWLWPWNPKPPRVVLRLPVVGPVIRIVWQDNGYFRIPLLGDTDSLREKVFGVVLTGYIVVVVLMTILSVALR